MIIILLAFTTHLRVLETRMRWTHLEDPGVDENLKQAGREGVEWIHLTQDRDQERVLVSDHGNGTMAMEQGSTKVCRMLD